MAFLKIDNALKRYGDAAVIHGVSLEAAAGEFVVFVGPSGCGKSTLLRMVAGLEDVSAGRIYIDGVDVTDVPPADRNVAMVFQSYALYPHMSVRDNMAFGLKMIKTPKAEIERRVAEAAAILKLDPLLERKPRALSGGQRQRVAIGRAIVRQPKLFLFDEPLSNLDAELRAEMRVEIATLHQRLGATMVYVTHDQVEAMTLADRIVVLRAGRIEQVGTPGELYDSPVNTFVAGFIGSPRMNFIAARVDSVEDRRVRLAHPALGGASLPLMPLLPLRNGAIVKPGDEVTLGLRPEHLTLEAAGAPLALSVSSEYVENLGSSSQLYTRTADGTRVIAQTAGRHATTRGAPLRLGASIEHAYLFDAQGQAL